MSHASNKKKKNKMKKTITKSNQMSSLSKKKSIESNESSKLSHRSADYLSIFVVHL